MNSKNTAELLDEIDKLHGYLTQYMTRENNVGEAMGKPGSRILNRIFDLSEAVRQEIALPSEESQAPSITPGSSP